MNTEIAKGFAQCFDENALLQIAASAALRAEVLRRSGQEAFKLYGTQAGLAYLQDAHVFEALAASCRDIVAAANGEAPDHPDRDVYRQPFPHS